MTLRLIIAGLLLVFMGACVPRADQQTVSTPAIPPKGVTAQATKEGWEAKWESVVAAGKKEGVVSLYALWPPETLNAISKAFRDKYAINLEVTVVGGSEIIPKIQAEHRAGLYLVDVYGQGTGQLVVGIKAAGLVGQIKPLLILPEVLDPKAWPGGQIPFADKDQQVIPMIANPQRYFIYNTDLVKKGELTAYKDVLKPVYKGKINLRDPTISGTGNAFFSYLAYNLWNLEETKEFLKRLITEQDVYITRDYRLQVETVARGKYAIGLAVQGSAVAEFIALGAPIDVPLTKEVNVSNQAGVLGVPKVSPHPNAATVFINWLLTKEGQTVYSKASGTPVMRLDVSQEGINPIFRLRPEDKAYYDTEESLEFKEQMYKPAREIIDAYAK